MALEPRCGALRPGALQLGGTQTGYLIHSIDTSMCTCSKRRKIICKTALFFHRKTLNILPLLFRKTGSYL